MHILDEFLAVLEDSAVLCTSTDLQGEGRAEQSGRLPPSDGALPRIRAAGIH